MTMVIAERPTGWRLWLTGIRPKTLTIAASPVIAGAGLAFYSAGQIDWLVLAVTLVCALAIQTGTNLYNDAADGLRGNDTTDRAGPPRLTAQGWMRPIKVMRAAFAAFGLAAFGGIYLVQLGGWPILAIGMASILCGYAYSGGPAPISRTPLGEVFVIAFFGVAAVAGTFFLQTGVIDASAVLAGFVVGLFGAAILMVNNYRDRQEDGLAGRRTLAIVAGERISKLAFTLFITVPFAVQLTIEASPTGVGNWLPLLPFPFAVYLARQFAAAKTGDDFNGLLVKTAKLQFAFSLLVAFGLTALKFGQAS